MDLLTHTATNAAAKGTIAPSGFSAAEHQLLQLQHQSFSFSLQHLIPLLAIIVWAIEYKRRAQPTTDSEFGKHLIRQLIPEMAGLTVLSGLVVVLLVCHREDHEFKGDEAWSDVKKEWPLLMTADTLIGLQAMLRLVFLLSASLRRSGAQLSPLDGEPAALFLLAALSRVILLALSPRDVYRLDGPLGGDMNVAVEVTACLLLLPLGYRMLQKGFCRVAGLLLVVLLLAASAKHNHFALADSSLSHLDMLFSLVMLLEMVAGVAFYVRSARVKGSYAWDAFTGFAHFMLPLQQALPAYFLLVAFAPPFKVEPSLVGQGRPFELLQAGGLVQVFMYMLAAALYYTACAEEKQVSTFAALLPPGETPPADECVICLGSCESCDCAEPLKPHWRQLQCGHRFHEHCIFEWLKKAQRCPMCRRHICEKSDAKWSGGASFTASETDTLRAFEAAVRNRPSERILAALDARSETEESVPLLAQDRPWHEDRVQAAEALAF